MFVIETERFFMREMGVQDALPNFEMNADVEVIQYTGDKAFESLEKSVEFWANYTPYKDYGVGRWAVIDKASKEFLGWCGLKYHPENGLYDLGYRFKKSAWGRGVATETAYASLKYGFEVLKIKHVYAQAMKQNPASINVMKKLGMVYSHDEPCGECDGVVYEMYRDWFH